jgi:hypothetical protein
MERRQQNARDCSAPAFFVVPLGAILRPLVARMKSLRYDKQSWFLEAAAIKLHGADPPAVSNESWTVTGTAYFKKTRLCIRARLESCATGENIPALAAAKPQGPQDQRSATKAFVVIVLWRR